MIIFTKIKCFFQKRKRISSEVDQVQAEMYTELRETTEEIKKLNVVLKNNRKSINAVMPIGR